MPNVILLSVMAPESTMIKISCKGLPETNALAFHKLVEICVHLLRTSVQPIEGNYIGVCYINLFTAVINYHSDKLVISPLWYNVNR
jgi:hypothetical protein